MKPKLQKSNNGEFWIKKILRNRERDNEVDKELLFFGWTVIRFWGNEIIKDVDECVKVIEETIFDMKLQDENKINFMGNYFFLPGYRMEKKVMSMGKASLDILTNRKLNEVEVIKMNADFLFVKYLNGQTMKIDDISI